MLLPRFILFGAVCLASLPAFGQELVTVTFGGNFVRWDVSDDSIIYSTPGPSSGFAALGRTNDDRFFAYRGDFAGNTTSLFELDPVDGSTTLVGNFGSGDPDSIVGLAGLNLSLIHI